MIIRYTVVDDEQGFHVCKIGNPFHIFTSYHNYDGDPTSAELQAREVCDALNEAFFKGYQYCILQELTNGDY